MDKIGTCKSCVFFRKFKCYRYPPEIHIRDDMSISKGYSHLRPVVEEEDFCGEYLSEIDNLLS